VAALRRRGVAGLMRLARIDETGGPYSQVWRAVLQDAATEVNLSVTLAGYDSSLRGGTFVSFDDVLPALLEALERASANAHTRWTLRSMSGFVAAPGEPLDFEIDGPLGRISYRGVYAGTLLACDDDPTLAEKLTAVLADFGLPVTVDAW